MDGAFSLIALHVLAYVPFAAQFPYDVVIVPKAHAASLLDLDGEERRDLAAGLRDVLGGLDGLFGAPYHYSLALMQAPTDGDGPRLSHANSHYVAFAGSWFAKTCGGCRYFWQSHQSLRSGYDSGGDPVDDAEKSNYISADERR